jgi:hypothetical protein
MTDLESLAQVEALKTKYQVLRPVMDERVRRLWAAAEALTLGYGGIQQVHAATGISRKTIAVGIRQLQAPLSQMPLRIRRPGGGRKPLTEQDPTLLADLEALVEPTTRGDPESPLRWTCKSLRKLAAELAQKGHRVSVQKVSELLQARGYRLQANKKTKEGGSHPDRDAQFAYINEQTRAYQQRGQPVIWVDTKKKELVGDFKNAGREWRPQGQPEQVRVHDFADPALGKAIPYGIYEVTTNQGWVSVGMDHDTAEFAVSTMGSWWRQMGKPAYPEAQELLVTADGGGSNGSRTRLWKVALQRLCDETGLTIRVCHFPPGTSKWNKIEHRLFSYITQNWRGRPLLSHEAVVSLIGSTKTSTGLTVQAALDTKAYATGIKVSDEELAAVRLERATFHGEWNYIISPTQHQDG